MNDVWPEMYWMKTTTYVKIVTSTQSATTRCCFTDALAVAFGWGCAPCARGVRRPAATSGRSCWDVHQRAYRSSLLTALTSHQVAGIQQEAVGSPCWSLVWRARNGDFCYPRARMKVCECLCLLFTKQWAQLQGADAKQVFHTESFSPDGDSVRKLWECFFLLNIRLQQLSGPFFNMSSAVMEQGNKSTKYELLFKKPDCNILMYFCCLQNLSKMQSN